MGQTFNTEQEADLVSHRPECAPGRERGEQPQAARHVGWPACTDARTAEPPLE